MFAQFGSAFGARSINLKPLLVGWAVAEVLAWLLAVKLLGLGATILLTMASSLLGVVLLRRIGLGAAQHLRSTVVGGGTPPQGALLDGTLGALGALLLILPGFVSDLAGLALAAPSVRQTLAARFGAAGPVPARKPTRPDVIDLQPDEWSVTERQPQGRP